MRRWAALAALLLLAAPAAAQIPFDPTDLVRIILNRPTVESGSPAPAPPPPWNGSRDLPPGYEVLRGLSGQPCHLRRTRLPFCLYSSDGRFSAIVAHAVTAWNGAGHQVGLGNLFEVVTVAEGADVRVQWNRDGLPPEAVAAVWWDPNLEYRRVLGITVEPDPDLPAGNLAQILMQELGHVLGLDHSEDPADVMHSRMHTRRYGSVDGARLGGRDVQALAWLYDQQEFLPIVGLRDGAGGVGAGSGAPASLPPSTRRTPAPEPSPQGTPAPVFTPVPSP